MKDALRSKKPRLSWTLHKRRLQLQLLTNFGKEQPAPDDTYQQHEQRFLALLQKLLDVRKSLDHYRTKALPEYCAACATLGADVWCVVSAEAVGKGVDAEKFRHAMCAINETKEVKNHYFNADEVLAGALRFLDIHINAMKSAKSQIEYRKRVKLDFDCYDRKVLKLIQHKASASKQLERNRLKLQQAKDALQAVTFDLYRVFAKYESERDSMLNGELEMVRQVMHGFYSRNAEATEFSIRDGIDRAAVNTRTDQIFNMMVSKELELNGSKVFGSAFSVPLVRPGDPGLTVPPALQPQPLKVDASTGEISDPTQLHPQSIQLSHSVDDELSEKLRTIQLSRPKIPHARYLKPKFSSNQLEGSLNR